MDMDTSGGASTSAATSAATSTAADASHVNLLGSEQKYVSYRDMITDILQSLHDEIKDDWLPQIQAKCLDYGFSVDVNTKLFRGKTIMDLFNLLLDQHKHDFMKIILLMRDIIPTVVCDSLSNEKLDLLAERIETDFKILGLKPDQPFYGREKEMKSLREFTDFTQDQKARLINVCGMTGIGKSYLVKNLALQTLKEGRCAVIYVDASGVQSIADLRVAILEKVVRFASGKAEDLMGTFCRFLGENKDSKILLILDDLSTIMSNKDNSDDLKSTKLVLEFLFDLTKRARNIGKKSKHCMLKTVVTTQKYMKMSSEKAEDKALVSVKQRLEDFTRDVSLDRLSDEDALKFLGPSLKTLTASDKEFLIKNCHGHPYSLHFVSSIASTDMNMTTEMTKMSGADVEAVNIELTEALFPKAYEKLTDLQKQVLLAICLFDRDASLEALYYIIKPTDLTKSQFYDEVKMRFKNEFWLTFRVSDVKVEATRKTLVNTHHPLIRKFIKNKITNYYMSQPGTEQYAYFSQYKARFITYHVTELINIGKACVPQNVSNADFAKDICSRLMNNRSNFRIMLSLLLESENPSLLFSLDGACLRPDTDIVHLFLCMFEYFDCFDGNLRTVLGELIMRPVKDSSVRVLLWALYTVALTTDKDWRTLDATFQRPDKESDPKKIISVSQELYSFCKAIYGYCSGMLHTHASWYKERTDKQLISKRKEALDTGINNLKLKHLSPTTDLARKYFSIHILLAQAEAIWTANKDNVNVIRQSFEVCRKAEKHSQQVLILEPLVYTELASYRFIEGDQCELSKAETLYTEAALFYEQVRTLYKKRKLENCGVAAHNLMSFGICMRSWANMLTNQNPVPDDDQKNAIKHLKRAADLSREAASIYDLLGSASRLSLLKSYFDAADSLELLQFQTPQTDRTSRAKYEMDALNYYQKAYNLLKNDYRSCHLGPNDPTLERLIERLPQLLRMHHTPTETIDKVKYNLQKIREEVGKEMSEGVNLSGSELYSSSDQESSDDDLVSSTEQLYMSGQQAVQPNFMSATNLVQETLPIQATDENPQSTKPMDVGPSAQGNSDSYTEEEASSKKRKL